MRPTVTMPSEGERVAARLEQLEHLLSRQAKLLDDFDVLLGTQRRLIEQHSRSLQEAFSVCTVLYGLNSGLLDGQVDKP